MVRNRRAGEEPGCKFIALLDDFSAPLFLCQTNQVIHRSCHDGCLDSVAAVGSGLGDVAATFHEMNDAMPGRGV